MRDLKQAIPALFLALCSASAQAAIVGDPAHPENLAQSLYSVYDHGDRQISIQPGTYQLPATAKDAIVLDHLKNTKIQAQGVVLIFDEPKHNPVHIIHCDHLTFEGATLRLAVAPDTQGRIRKIDSDAKTTWCDWQVNTGYRTDIDPIKMTYNVVDAQTRLLRVETGDLGPSASEKIAPDTFRLHFRGKPKFAENDWLVTRAGGGSVICHVDDSTNVTLHDLTLQNGGFGTIFETGGGGNHYLNCRMVRGPKPEGATEEPLIACGADGFHSTETSIGPDIEDCDFNGVFLDDCIAIHGIFQKVLSSAGQSITLTGYPRDYSVSDPIRFSNEKGFFSQAICTGVKDLGNKQVQVAIDQPLDIPIDTKANNPNRCGRGFKILRCHLGNTRSRGILVKADDGIIDHCTIEGCGMSAISIGPEYYWNEANYAWNVTVSNNTIKNCDKDNRNEGTIWIHGDGAIGNRNITIADNLFDINFGQFMIKAEWTDGLQITGNKFVHCFQLPQQKPGEVIHLNHIHHASLKDNTAEDTGPAFGKPIGIGSDVSDPTADKLGGIDNK